MSDPMTDVIEARDAYLAAREQVREARLALGKAIAEARAENVDQAEIARKLKLTREQIRRYQDEYEKAAGLKPTARPAS
jgi:helix-turn-helix protein